MTLFHYPKSKHTRSLKPRQFKRYQTYKRYLQSEFVRLCVYCRQPDSSAPNLNFGVDHYRPKGIARFAKLICTYDNLYYCCSNCNSRKNNDWPVDEAVGPYVINPCDYEMAAHLRFNARTGEVESRTMYGKHTVDLLQLNDDATVQYRLGSMRIVSLFTEEIGRQQEQLNALARKLRSGGISQSDYNAAVDEIKQEVDSLRSVIDAQTGVTPLSPLKAHKKGLTLLQP